jgi:hypothetical protein
MKIACGANKEIAFTVARHNHRTEQETGTTYAPNMLVGAADGASGSFIDIVWSLCIWIL